MSLKKEVYSRCHALVAGKIAAQETALKELQSAVGNETKSTAGDKYETARAMLHIEQDNVRSQLAVLMTQKAVLDRMDPDSPSVQVIAGSLVKTDRGYYFLSVALGKIDVEGQTVIALSPQSPLGAKLMGKKAGDRLEQNGMVIAIEIVF